jgi:hypothetical protein
MANFDTPLLFAPVGTGPLKGAGAWWAVNRRFMLYELEFGQTGTLAPTDCQCQWDLSRFASTLTMTGSTVAANLLDQADVTAVTLFMNNLTTEPVNITTVGLGLNLKQWAINQRGFYRWRALDDGDNIIVASAASQGIELRTLSSNFAATAIGNGAFIER